VRLKKLNAPGPAPGLAVDLHLDPDPDPEVDLEEEEVIDPAEETTGKESVSMSIT
jgi:hypothetical protein